MWSRVLTVLVLVATAAVAGWIALRGVIWVDREVSVVALAGAAEIAAIGLLAAAALQAWSRWRGRARALGVGASLLLLGVVPLRDLPPRRPAVGSPGEVAVERPAGRTLWVCVDGLSWSRVLPLVEAGRMPHMARLLEAGASAVLRSEPTYRRTADRWGWWSPVIWTSLATGRSPQAHGITDFTLPDPDGGERADGRPRRRAAASFHRRVPAFWNLFSAFGRSVGVVGWWGSWPAEEVAGVMITDRVGLRSRRADDEPDLADAEGLTHPPSLARDVGEEIARLEKPPPWVETELYPFRRYPVIFADDLESVYGVLWQDELYVRLAEELLRERPDLDLATVYIEGIDALSHHLWKYMADPDAEPVPPVGDEAEEYRLVVDRYHERVDAYLGRLLAAAGEGVRVVLTSDHGFRLTPDGEYEADHSAFGTLVLAGDGVRRGHSAMTLAGSLAGGPVSVPDVLPTLLYWNGLPIADELEGEPLYRFFERSYLRRHPAVRIDTYGDFATGRQVEIPLPDAADEEYLERLKALGYIQ